MTDHGPMATDDVWDGYLREGYAVIREGDATRPWTAGEEVQVYPVTVQKWGQYVQVTTDVINPGPARPIPRWTRLRWWWAENRPHIHRGPCNHDDCE